MYNLKLGLIKSLLHVRKHFNCYMVAVSLISVAFLLLKLIGIDILLNFESNTLFGSFFGFFWMISSIFIILFLPSYPIFFTIYKKLNFNTLEKICLTIVINLSFYIITGYFGNGLGFALNIYFFFSLLLSFYFGLLIISVILNKINKVDKATSLESKENQLLDSYEDFQVFEYIKNKLSLNGILLIIFAVLLITALLVNVEIFGGTDPWYHILIIRIIVNANSLPLNEYFGAMGFHIIGAVFHIFSGIELLLIPNSFILFTIPLTSLIVYNIIMRVFSNKSLAIFGIFILLITALGFINLTFQYWPSSLVFIQGLTIFFLLYARLRNFIKIERPSWKKILSDLPFTYLYISIVFIALYLSHSLIGLIFLISIAWIYLIYLVRDFKRGFDFTLCVILLVVFLILVISNISTGHLRVFNSFFTLPWVYLLFGAISITIIGGLLIAFLRTQIKFEKGRFNLILMGKKFKFHTIIEKYFIPLVFSVTIVFTVGFFIANLLWLNLNLITIFVGFEIIILVIFAIWGLVIFQNKAKGKPLFLWFLSFVILILAGLFSDMLQGSLNFVSRLFYIASPIIAIGFLSYVYKLIKTGKIKKLQIKIFFLFFVSFSATTSYLELFSSIDFFSINNNELTAVHWYLQNSDDRNLLIVEFGWFPVFLYYDYPYEDKNSSLSIGTTQDFITINNILIIPDNHLYDNGTNVLKELKEQRNKDVYILLTKNYLTTSEMEFYGELTEEQYESYYTLEYLNRIFSVKYENGESLPYYWVI
ncbi:MAG: hypothetical protein ACTSQL_00440 [Promethearchaeota archaeon]